MTAYRQVDPAIALSTVTEAADALWRGDDSPDGWAWKQAGAERREAFVRALRASQERGQGE